jgi:3-hydroxyacyl-[acyl-carrier-protein] dehydratase
MPPPVILDPALIDFSHVVMDRAQIEATIPHRFEFLLIDAVVAADAQSGTFAAYHDVKCDAFWVRGHIPDRPLLPGVLMIECAAQLASIMYRRYFPEAGFIGFTGVDRVRFRGVVQPPARLLIVGKAVEAKRRRVICDAQGFVDGQMVFEGRITGMPV